jgi:glycosyl transferase family 87
MRPVTFALVALRIVVLVLAIEAGRTSGPTDDLARFAEIKDQVGVPYRDFPVEYAPVETLIVRFGMSTDPVATAARVAVLAFVADIATWWAVRIGWGARAGERYLWLGAPLLVFLYTRFDLVPVALAAWGAVLAIRGSQRAGGATIAIAALTKLWPAVLIPGFLVAGCKRAFAWAVVAGGGLIAVWVAFGGISGLTDVLTFRHAGGWEVESTVGTVVWIATGGPIRIEAGAPRVGSVSPFASGALLVALTGSIVAIWMVAMRRKRAAFGAASVAAIGALLACSSVFSLQYAAWLLPWAAVAWAEDDRRQFWTVAVIEVLTAILFIVYEPQRATLAQTLLIARSLLVIALPVMWLLGERHDRTSSAPASADGSVTGNRQTNR